VGGAVVVAGAQATSSRRSRIKKAIFFMVDSFYDFVKSPPNCIFEL